MTDIPTEVDNDVVMLFLHEYRPEGIDRAVVGGNLMPSAIILMQTAQGHDLAVQRLNDTMLGGRRAVLQTFDNPTQDVLDRVLNAQTTVFNIAGSSDPPPVDFKGPAHFLSWRLS